MRVCKSAKITGVNAIREAFAINIATVTNLHVKLEELGASVLLIAQEKNVIATGLI